MQRLFEIRNSTDREYNSLKKLWSKCFDDSADVIDNFFKKTVTPENTVSAFYNGEAVSALYIIESTIFFSGQNYPAFYIYAVCTDPDFRGQGLMKKCFDFLFEEAKSREIDYIFLVPASDSLFEMYKKLGFKTGFSYSQKIVNRACCDNKITDIRKLCYNDYVNIRKAFSTEKPVAVLDEKGFNSFYSPVGETIRAFKSGDGYAVYETENGAVTVHEIFGDEEILLQSVFELSGSDCVVVRSFSDNNNNKISGMYKTLGDVPELSNAFFGIPYGG
ncbi:MAG: GNAT family N-acetyltransferase [Clostridia bacterium]|nr:GNAT family N-acetyltransferase [Clostridia bacterium]